MTAGPAVLTAGSRRPRGTLATRISLLCAAIAIVTALVAGGIATGLIRSASDASAERTLGRFADVAQSVAMERTPIAARNKLQKALYGLQIRFGVATPRGAVLTRATLIRESVTPADIHAVLAGEKVSTQTSVDGHTVFVEGRPVGNRGIFVVQKRRDAIAPTERALRDLLLALLIAAVAAAIIGLLVARWLARPLRRTAAAAHSVAAGNRDVALPDHGPAEVVAVSEAVSNIAGALRHSEARQREFLLSVSHDLRTPLTAISGYAESLADGVVPPDESGHVGGVMLGEARRLERLVGDLLDLARLGAEDFRIDFGAVEVTGFVEDAAQVWSARCAAAGVAFRLERPDGPLWAWTDASRLRQLLDGLFDNALRVTPPGAPIVLAARLGPAGATGGSGVLVEVRDGGPGLRDDDLAVAFQQGALYERYRGVRQVGTGLGLAIVHGLVTRLGGTIEAGHAVEGGARFLVVLPAARPPIP